MAPDHPDEVVAWAAATVVDLRRAVRLTQRQLGALVGISQSVVCDIEAARQPELSLQRFEGLIRAMGGRLRIDIDRPFIDESARLDDLVHARCCLSAAHRLERLGWEVETEVEVGGDRSRGWIDILAFHPVTGSLLVVEVKTEIHDLGQLERRQGWYEREAPRAASRFGWRPRRVASAVFVLSSNANDEALKAAKPMIDRVFSRRARELQSAIDRGEVCDGRGIAMVDPRSRRMEWLRPLKIDGRRRPAPYRDYRDCLQVISRRGAR